MIALLPMWAAGAPAAAPTPSPTAPPGKPAAPLGIAQLPKLPDKWTTVVEFTEPPEHSTFLRERASEIRDRVLTISRQPYSPENLQEVQVLWNTLGNIIDEMSEIEDIVKSTGKPLDPITTNNSRTINAILVDTISLVMEYRRKAPPQEPTPQVPSSTPPTESQTARKGYGVDDLVPFGNAAQTAFMKSAYERQKQRATERGSGRQYFPGLKPEQLKSVGNNQAMHFADAAEQCNKLLAAARADLAREQQVGNVDPTIRIGGVVSGYRSPAKDVGLWQGAFRKHYPRVMKELERLIAGGDPKGGIFADREYAPLVKQLQESKDKHGQAAVAMMAKHMSGIKAVAGFSRHTSGIGGDFTTTEKRKTLGPNTDQRAAWREAWFHRKWLKAHAREYGFQPLATEEWHWDYIGTKKK